LMEIGMLSWDSAISLTYAICWARTSIVWKGASFRRNLQIDVGTQNSARRGKSISSGTEAAAAVPSDIMARSL
jgi:hypothetical protein